VGQVLSGHSLLAAGRFVPQKRQAEVLTFGE